MKLAGWVLSGLVALFLVGASATPKFLGSSGAVDSMTALGWPTGYLVAIGALEFVLAALYLVPRTSLVAAILLSGLLGGAIASHLRVASPLWTHTLFGVYLGLALWVGLVLRDTGLQAYLRNA
jgi:hypothetical protein